MVLYILRLSYLCLFTVSGMSCYKSYHKSSLEALKLFCCTTVVAQDYVAYNFCSDVLLRIRVCDSLINSVLDVS